MIDPPEGMALPASLHDVDADFMTRLLRARGVIAPTNAVVHTADSDVGMTAGYFSAIKRVKCTYREPTDAQDVFIVKAWPDFEMAPKESIAEMFARDIQGYLVDEQHFFPRPKVYLAAVDEQADRWALVLEDASTFGTQKVHEHEMGVDEVMHLIPKMVDVALAWEGCHAGDKSLRLDALNIDHWASESNLSTFKTIMPGGARLFDHVTALPDSSLVSGVPWDTTLGPGFSELFTRKLDAYYNAIKPENGGTCTLAHGDFRGDNLFFCTPSAAHPEGWLAIDFQLMFRGPVPADLAYLMSSGSVLPDVYGRDNRERVLREFYDRFMTKTRLYGDYTWEQFRFEFAIMATVQLVYYVGFGAAIWQAGLNNEQPGRIELGDQGATVEDLTPEERRKRMWWTKTIANFNTIFQDFDHFQHLSRLPSNERDIGDWVDVPERLGRSG